MATPGQRRRVMLVLLLVFSVPALCLTADCDPEIGSLIMRQTQTRIGEEFYREFACQWEPLPGTSMYHIVIKERADPRWGSQIIILVDDEVIYKDLFGIRTQDLRETVRNAVSVVRNHMAQLSLRERLLHDGDLKGDGF